MVLTVRNAAVLLALAVPAAGCDSTAYHTVVVGTGSSSGGAGGSGAAAGTGGVAAGTTGGHGAGGGAPCEGFGSWTPTSTTGAPAERWAFATAWTGHTVVVWGGFFVKGFPNGLTVYHSDGAQYDPDLDTWVGMTADGAPSKREWPTAVWSGLAVVIWGGWEPTNDAVEGTGAVYDPAIDQWSPMTTDGAPRRRTLHTAVWTNSEMIVWGGAGLEALSDGGRYDPTTDTWSAMSSEGVPQAREGHGAVWTGSEMIVWGGQGAKGEALGTGGVYNPTTDTWRPTATKGAPSPRYGHGMVWTGSGMIVWGGESGESGPYHGDGGLYDPVADTWTPTSQDGAPKSRAGHVAVWSGKEMIVWGGYPFHAPGTSPATGGLFNPETDTWRATSTCAAPRWQLWAEGVWTGSQMIVFGGMNAAVSQGEAGLGAVYTPP